MQDAENLNKTTLSIKDEQLLCTVSQLIPKQMLERFYDDTLTLLNKSIPTITNHSVVDLTDVLCVVKTSFLIPKEMENYDDIKTLIKSVDRLLTCTATILLADNAMSEEQQRIRNIFKDFNEDKTLLPDEDKRLSSQYDNIHKPCIAAILTKVGTKRAQTANLIADYCDITKESASAIFLKVLNGSAGEFVSLFHDTNKANEFSERMKSLGNEIMLQQ